VTKYRLKVLREDRLEMGSFRRASRRILSFTAAHKLLQVLQSPNKGDQKGFVLLKHNRFQEPAGRTTIRKISIGFPD
jgi:hypothetical protein